MVWLVVGWCCRLRLVDDAGYKGEWEGHGGCERLGGGVGRSVIWTCRRFPPIIRPGRSWSAGMEFDRRVNAGPRPVRMMGDKGRAAWRGR